MPRTSYKVYETEYPYYMTCSIVDWLPIFSIPAVTRKVLESLTYFQKKHEFTLYAYVIMENHFHLIAQSPDLQKHMRSFKSYTARQIIDHIKMNGHNHYQQKLRSLKLEHHTDSDFQLYFEGYHPKKVVGDKMMNQKVSYIHQNPVKRGYVDMPEDWRYSSARDYAGERGLIPVTLFKR